MKIIRLNELQFKNYSNMHNMQNLCQTIEYSHIEENRTKEKEFLGLIDENNNVCAAVTIIVKNLIMNNKMATIYNMPLIDYNNYSLLNIFFEELKNIDPNTAVSKHYIRQLIISNKIPYRKAGNKYLFDFDRLVEYFDEALHFEDMLIKEGGNENV